MEDVVRVLPDLKQGEAGVLQVVEMNGADLLQTLEHSITVGSDGKGWFYYFSGLRMIRAFRQTRIAHSQDHGRRRHPYRARQDLPRRRHGPDRAKRRHSDTEKYGYQYPGSICFGDTRKTGNHPKRRWTPYYQQTLMTPHH